MEKEVQEKAELQLPPPPPSLPIYGPSRDRRPYFEVVGAWTKAGIASCIHIKSQTDDVLLDCGVNEASTFSAKVIIKLFTFDEINLLLGCFNLSWSHRSCWMLY